MLKTLETAAGFDGLILVDGASMGMPAGGIGIFSLNELILPGSPPVEFDNVDIEGDILYASKFLSLPPMRIIGIQSGETHASFAAPFLDAIRSAIEQLTQA
jgi:Ni,Fe-hydrogenase maturation factor